MSVACVIDRRAVLGLALALAAAGSALGQEPVIAARPFIAVPIPHAIARTSRPMKIGVIGSGRIGGTLGELMAKAGHQVLFSDREQPLAAAQAARVAGTRAGTVPEAIAFGDVVVIATPFGAWPAVAREYGALLRGKVVLDPTNPNAEVGSSRVDLQACKLEYSIVSPK